MSVAFTKQPSALSLTGSKAISNPITFQIAGSSAFVNGTLRSFYRIGVRIFIEDVLIATFERPVRAAVSGDTLPAGFVLADTGIMQIDIAEVLRMRLFGQFTFPHDDYIGSYNRLDILNRFHITIYETYGTPPVEQDGAITTNYFYVLQGQLGNFAQGQLNKANKTIYDKLLEEKPFLTNAPLTKSIDIYQPERLYFLFLQNFNGYLCIKHYYSDGTTEISKSTQLAALVFNIYEFIVDYKQIRKSAPKKLVKYEVWLGDTTIFYSEIRTYVIDYRYQRYARYFNFLNSWGVYETLRTTGKVDRNEKVDKKFITLVLPENFIETDREQIQTDTGIVTATNKINSGYLNQYWSAWLQEFLTSKDVYFLKRGKAYPVNISAGKRTISSDGDFNPFTEFELTHALTEDFNDEFIAQEPIVIGDYPIDFVTDYFSAPAIIYYANRTKIFTRNNCNPNYDGSSIVFSKDYTSTISQEDANAKIAADTNFNTEGQNFANAQGICSLRGPVIDFNFDDGVMPTAIGSTGASIENGKLVIISNTMNIQLPYAIPTGKTMVITFAFTDCSFNNDFTFSYGSTEIYSHLLEIGRIYKNTTVSTASFSMVSFFFAANLPLYVDLDYIKLEMFD